MDLAMKYELLIRYAFELVTGRPVDRFGDPGGLANTDFFTSPRGVSPFARIGLGYAVAILTEAVEKAPWYGSLPPGKQPPTDLVERIGNAATHADMATAVEEAWGRVLMPFFDIKDGVRLKGHP